MVSFKGPILCRTSQLRLMPLPPRLPPPGPRMSGRSRRGGRWHGPAGPRRGTARRRSQTRGFVLAMGARMRGGPSLTRMRERAHAIEVLTAVCTFHGHAPCGPR
jgi:hypothetical protein